MIPTDDQCQCLQHGHRFCHAPLSKSQNVAQKAIKSATHKLTRCSHLLLLTALYTGTAITMGSNNQSGRLMTHDSSQSLLNTNINKVWSRDYACSAVVQQLHVQACLCGVSPKLGVGLSQGLDVPKQCVVILHLHSRFLQVLGYLLPNL